MVSDNRRDDAIAWHVRLRDPAASEQVWADFTNWLEADVANADAYDAVARADANYSEILSSGSSQSETAFNDNEEMPTPWYQRRRLLAAVASVALVVLISPAFLPSRALQITMTKPGETREISLADGSQIALNGGSKLLLDGKDKRFARLEAGEAVFTIRHDAAHPFVVEAGAANLKDLGTVFNVRHGHDGLDVTVAEGAVQYNASAQATTVSAGNRLQVARDQASPVLTKVDPGSVAGWRRGMLTYQQAQLSAIALDLSRATGTPVRVSNAIADRRFTGIVRVERDQKLLFHRLEALLGVRAEHNAAGWNLTP